MTLLRLVRARLFALFHRDVVADEIREELEFHVKARTEQYEREGLPPTQAMRKARRRVGNLAVHQDRGYDVRGGGLLETVVQDVLYSLRLLQRQRGFAVVAILTIALGIGASTAIFSVIDAAMLRPMPYPNPEQLVSVSVEVPQPNGRRFQGDPSIEDTRLWLESGALFSRVAAWRFSPQVLVEGASAERFDVMEVSNGFLDLYAVAPIHGRAFADADMVAGSAPVILLGYDYWQTRHGGRSSVVGERMSLGGVPATIIGILPRTFRRQTAIWRPLIVTPGDDRRATGKAVYARLKPGISLDAAAVSLTTLTRAAEPPGDFSKVSVHLTSLLNSTTGDYRVTVTVIAGAVGLILLIACVNVAGLLLARGATREHELAIRASLGAGRWRLFRQLLTESIVLSALGGLVGVVVAWVAFDAILANIPIYLPSDAPAALNIKVLASAGVLALCTGVVFGVLPAMRLSRAQVGAAIAHGQRRQGPALSLRGGQAVIAIEIALAVVLLAGAGLMIRSFSRVMAVDLGFNPAAFVALDAQPIDPAQHVQFYRALLPTVRALPEVTAAGAINQLPLKGSSSKGLLEVEGGPTVGSNVRLVLPGYFEAIGLSLRHGRLFTDDDVSSGFPVAIVSEEASKRLFGASNPLGQRLRFDGELREVVGVVGDVRHWGPFRAAEGEAYRLFEATDQRRSRGMTVVVRATRQSRGLAEGLRQAASAVGPKVLVEGVRTGPELFGATVLTPKRRTVLLTLLGGLGLVLTLVGVLGVTAYAVARRTQEIGVRIALGARPGQVVWQITRDSAIPIGAGVAAGLVGAYFATRVIKTFLFETAPTDPLTLAVVAMVLTLTAILAAWMPARRAARVDPVSALRAE